MSEPRFGGRVALVTGGGGGLGRAVAAALAAEGAAVAAGDVVLAGAGDVAAALSEAGARALALELDVADPGSVAAAFARVEAELGGLDVLVNLAGGSLGTPRDLPEIAPEDYDRVLDVNLRGTFLCCQAAVPLLARRGGGAIVNVSSIAARGTTPVTGVPYAAAKAGVLGLTRRLAREVGPLGIRVNAVAPGLFLSGPRLEGMWVGLSAGERAEVLDAIPLRRLPELAEAVAPILFLASADASYVTGAVLDVNGGRFMAG
ncbi:MAG: SDR family oxidoreductase [Thermoleophilia bacterium]|nr:SDR family oxidoreductase [Thermoleophilia bacterium]